MSSSRRRHLAVLVSALVMLGLVTTACGSSSSGSGTTAVAASSADAGSPAGPASGGGSPAAGSPIKIGLAAAETGFNAEGSGSTVPAAKAWADWVNANGGIGGHQVAIVDEDTAGTPSTALSAVKTLVTSDHVVAVMIEDAATDSVVAPYLQQNNIPVIGLLGFAPDPWTKYSNFFQIAAIAPATNIAQYAAAKAVGGKTMMAVECAEVPVCAQVGQQLVAKSGTDGVTFEGQLLASASAPNYTAQCLIFKQKNIDVVGIGLTTAVLQKLIGDCAQQGYTGSYALIAGEIIQKDLDTVKGVKFGGAMVSFPWWVNAAPVAEFRSAMSKYAPQLDFRNTFVATTWTALQLFKKAVSANPDNLTPAKVLNAYYGIKDETLGGLLPQPITFTRGKASPAVTCFWPLVYTAGDQSPKAMQVGPSGNNASGGLSSSCNTQG